MIPRTMTITFVGALAIGAYAAGCGSGDPTGTGTGQYGDYHGGPASSGSSSCLSGALLAASTIRAAMAGRAHRASQ